MGTFGDIILTGQIKVELERHGCAAEPWACAISGVCRNRCGAPGRATEAKLIEIREATEGEVEAFHMENPPTNAELAAELGVSKRQASKIRKQLGIGSHVDSRDIRAERRIAERVMGKVGRKAIDFGRFG